MFDENPTVSSTPYASSNERVIVPAVGKLYQKPNKDPSGGTNPDYVHPFKMTGASETVKCNVCIPSDRIESILVNPLSPWKEGYLESTGRKDVPCMSWYDSASYTNGMGFICSKASDLFGSDRLFGEKSFCVSLLYKTSVSTVDSIKGEYVVCGFGRYVQWLGGTTKSCIITDIGSKSSGWQATYVEHSSFSNGWVALVIEWVGESKKLNFYAHGKLVATKSLSGCWKMDLSEDTETFYFNKQAGTSGVKLSVADICVWEGRFTKKDSYAIQTIGVEASL